MYVSKNHLFKKMFASLINAPPFNEKSLSLVETVKTKIFVPGGLRNTGRIKKKIINGDI